MTFRLCRDDQITANQEGKVDPSYLAEVERMTARRERAYRLNEQREVARAALVEAEAEVHAAKQTRSRAAIREAWKMVEARRTELRRIERLMTTFPGASTSHRGIDSIWPVADESAVHRGEPDKGPRVSDGRAHPVHTRRVDPTI